jgi:hypothetical protein
MGAGLLLESASRRRVWAHNMPWAYSASGVVTWMLQGASKTRFVKYFGSGTYFMRDEQVVFTKFNRGTYLNWI